MRPRMSSLTRAFVVSALAVGLTAAAAAGASAASSWDKHGGDCDDTAFKAPNDAGLKVVSTCVKLFEAYQQPSKVKGAYRDRVIAAMQRLYIEGSVKESKIAKSALARMGVRDLPPRGKAAARKAADKAAPARKKFAPDDPSKREIKAAERHFKYGYKQYKKKKYGRALTHYEKMVDAAPGYAKGHYNVACMHAKLGDERKMGEALLRLSDMGDNGNDDALKLLKMARTDTDFEDIRDDSVPFKRLTGYARIKVFNAMGERGEENVDNLEASLKKLNFEIDGPDESGKKRKHPIVWFAEHAKPAAYIVKELLNHPKTQTVMFTVEQLKGYDVVAVWGDDLKDDDDPEVYVSDPDDAEKKLDELARKEDEILRKPEEAVDDVEDALETPDRIKDRIEDNLERPGKAIDRAGKTVDKVKGLFD